MVLEEKLDVLAEDVASDDGMPERKPPDKPQPLGFCPICGVSGYLRGIDGLDMCRNGHVYKSAMAKQDRE